MTGRTTICEAICGLELTEEDDRVVRVSGNAVRNGIPVTVNAA